MTRLVLAWDGAGALWVSLILTFWRRGESKNRGPIDKLHSPNRTMPWPSGEPLFESRVSRCQARSGHAMTRCLQTGGCPWGGVGIGISPLQRVCRRVCVKLASAVQPIFVINWVASGSQSQIAPAQGVMRSIWDDVTARLSRNQISLIGIE